MSPEHEIDRQIRERRSDPEFMSRLLARMEQDRDLLAKIAASDYQLPREDILRQLTQEAQEIGLEY